MIYLLLGSDLGDKKKNLLEAKRHLAHCLGEIVITSELMETAPVGFTSDTMFLNQIVGIETEKSPIQLLKIVKQIEKKMGRVYLSPKKGEKYTSRIIDIDILRYDDLEYKSNQLLIPHPQCKTRDFVNFLFSSLLKH